MAGARPLGCYHGCLQPAEGPTQLAHVAYALVSRLGYAVHAVRVPHAHDAHPAGRTHEQAAYGEPATKREADPLARRAGRPPTLDGPQPTLRPQCDEVA